MKSPLMLALLCQSFLLNAQSIADFKPARYVDTIPSGIYAMIKFRYTQEVNNIQGPAKNKAEVKVQYKDLFDATILRFNDDHFMVDSGINDYLNSIVTRCKSEWLFVEGCERVCLPIGDSERCLSQQWNSEHNGWTAGAPRYRRRSCLCVMP